MWIRIKTAPLDPGPDPYLEYGSGSVLEIRIRFRIQDIQNGVQKDGKVCAFKLERALTVLLRA